MTIRKLSFCKSSLKNLGKDHEHEQVSTFGQLVDILSAFTPDL